MLFIGLTWILLFLLVVGLGGLALQMLTFRSKMPGWSTVGVFDLFWVGLLTLLGTMQLVSAVLPLDGRVLLALCGLSLVGLVTATRAPIGPLALANIGRFGWWRPIGFLIVFVPLVVVAAARLANTAPTLSYDTDLYHYSAVSWANAYPAVPGLANLHCRLGVPSGYLLLAALVDNAWWDGRTAWIMPGFIPLAVIAQWILFLLFDRGPRRLPLRLFCLFTAPYLLWETAGLAPRLDNDSAIHFSQLALVAAVLRYGPRLTSSFRRQPMDSRGAWIPWLTLVAIAAASFGFKPSGGVVFAFVALIAALATMVGLARRRPISSTIRTVALLASLPVLLVLGFLTRNAIQSGWLLYPAAFGRLDVSWAVPAHPIETGHPAEMQSVVWQYKIIQAWARQPGPEYIRALDARLSAWVPPWWDRFRHTMAYRLLCIGAGLSLLLVVGWCCRRRRGTLRQPVLECAVLLGCLASLLSWFLTAPDVRFGEGSFWILAAFPASIILAIRPLQGRWCTLAAPVLFAGIALGLLRLSWPSAPPSLWAIGHSQARAMRLHRFPLSQPDRFDLYVPDDGDQCGDAPLPCTPYVVGPLKLRRHGNLGAGFFLDLPVPSPKP